MSKQWQAKTTEKLHFAKLQLRLLSAVKENEALNQLNQLKALRQSVLNFIDAGWRAFLGEICLHANVPPQDWNRLNFAEAQALFERANRASPELNQLHALLSDPRSWLTTLLEEAALAVAVVVAKEIDKPMAAGRIPVQAEAEGLDDEGLAQRLAQFEDLITTMRDTMLEW